LSTDAKYIFFFFFFFDRPGGVQAHGKYRLPHNARPKNEHSWHRTQDMGHPLLWDRNMPDAETAKPGTLEESTPRWIAGANHQQPAIDTTAAAGDKRATKSHRSTTQAAVGVVNLFRGSMRLFSVSMLRLLFSVSMRLPIHES